MGKPIPDERFAQAVGNIAFCSHRGYFHSLRRLQKASKHTTDIIPYPRLKVNNKKRVLPPIFTIIF